MLAIVGALRDELSALLELMPDERIESRFGRRFRRGHLHGQEVVVVLSGIGKVAAATTASLLIERFQASRIVFTGVAGGLGPGVNVGDMVLAQRLLQHDLNAEPLFPRYEVPGYGRASFDVDAELAGQLGEAAARVLADLPQRLGEQAVQAFGLQAPRLHRGLLISGDRFVSSHAEVAQLQADLPEALAVEMEGAAFAQVCHDAGVPLAVLRTISDRADDSAHVDFARFLRQVASRYSAALIDEWLRAP